MNIQTGSLVTLLIVSISIFSCQEKIEPALDNDDFQYLPLEVGNEWIYDQTEIIYEISSFDTLAYQVKEVVISGDSIDDSTMQFIIERSIRNNESDDWSLESRYQIRRSRDWMLSQIGNQTYTTHNFPVIEGKTWDYNSHNTLSENSVQYQADTSSILDQPVFADIPGSASDIFVILSNVPRNIVNQNQHHELYVKNVGLVEKKFIVLEFCTVNCDSAGQINTGRYLLKQLHSYEIQ